MKAISIRNVPDDIYEQLKEWSKKNHRSLHEQVRYILEREVRLVKKSPLAEAAEWRKKLAGRQFSDVVQDIKEGRNR